MLKQLIILAAIIHGQIIAPSLISEPSARLQSAQMSCCNNEENNTELHGCCKENASGETKDQSQKKNECNDNSCQCINLHTRSNISLLNEEVQPGMRSKADQFHSTSEPLIYNVYTSIWQPPKIS
jgi:hypothetical protein